MMDYDAEARKLWDKLFLEHRNSDYPVHIEIIATALREAVEERDALLKELSEMAGPARRGVTLYLDADFVKRARVLSGEK